MKKYLPLLIACIALVKPASARAQVQLVVSPPRYDIEIKPGETAQKTIKVTNDSDSLLTVRATISDFIVQDDAGTPLKVTEEASGRFLASPWFTLDKQEFVIPPGTQEQIIVLVTAPEDALPGGHYAGVFFEPVAPKGTKETVSYTAVQVGSLFGITIAGDIKYDAFIKEFSTKTSMYEYGPVDFKAVIENQSDTHIMPQASITVRDMLGRSLTTLALDDVNIFPLTSRTLSKTWDQVWGLGRYTATLTVLYGPGLTAERTMYFWILPWRLIAAIAVVVLGMIAAFITVRRHIVHRKDTRDHEIDELKRRIVELENSKR